MTKSYLIDSNVLIYALNKDSPYHDPSIFIIDKVLKGQIIGYITTQNLFETFAILTDKRRITNPLTPSDAYSLIASRYLSGYFKLIQALPNTYQTLFELCQKFNIIAQNIYDVTIVAVMKDHNLSDIITYDKQNFQQFNFIKPFAPNEIV